MKINSVKYFVKEASKNVFSNGWMSIASVFTVVASLLVFGVFLILAINLNFMVGQVEKGYEIFVKIDESFTEEQTRHLGESLELLPNVSEVIFESKDERLNSLRQQWGEDGDLLDRYQNEENPLYNWYKVRCEDLALSDQTTEAIKELSGVASVASDGETINKLTSASDYISRISIWLMIALGVISIFIISNTIKLTVFSRRREINIMKYVGATDWFIRWPFIIEGMIIGMIGAAVSVLLVSLGYEGLIAMMAALNIAFVRFIPFGDIAVWFIIVFILLGILLGALGSLISVRKHLKV